MKFDRLIFIYNSNSGVVASAADSYKKLVNDPSGCALCKITHGLVMEKKTWKAFLQSAKIATDYYHLDDLPERIKVFLREKGEVPPIVLGVWQSELDVLVNAEELKQMNGSEEELIKALEQKLNTKG